MILDALRPADPGLDPLLTAAFERAEALAEIAAVERRLGTYRLRGRRLYRASCDYVCASERLKMATYRISQILERK